MHEIQIISLAGRPAALVVAGTALVGEHVPRDRVAHVQAKALFALKIQAGELPGPYTDAHAERYARRAQASSDPAGRSAPRPRRAPGRGHGRRPV